MNIKRAYIYPTLACNLQCPDCYTLKPATIPQFNSKTQRCVDAFEVVAKLLHMGVTHFDISGGEPLLYPRIDELCRFIKRTVGTRISLVTNGTLVRARQRLVQDLMPQIDECAVSLESGDAIVNDHIRGPGSFREACAGLECLAAMGAPKLTINTVVFPRHAVADIVSVVALAIRIGAVHVHFMELKWQQKWAPAYHQMLHRIMSALRDMRSQTDAVRITVDVPAVFLRALKHQWATELGRAVRIRSLNLRGSQAFNGEIVVTSSGMVTGSVDMVYNPHFVAGNIIDDSTDTILDRIRECRSRIAERKRLLHGGDCQNCELWNECSGGNPEMAVVAADWESTRDRRCPFEPEGA